MSLSPSQKNTVLLIRRNASERDLHFEFSNYELVIIAYSLSSTEYDKEIRASTTCSLTCSETKVSRELTFSSPVMNDEKKEEEEVQVIRMRRLEGRIGIKFDMEMNMWTEFLAKQSGIRVGHKIVACEGIQIESHAELVSAIPSRGDNRAFSLHVKYIGVRRVRFNPHQITENNTFSNINRYHKV